MTSVTALLKKKNFDAKLEFTDTDSLTYEIKSEDAYEEFLVTIQKIQSFLVRLIKTLLVK